MCAACADKADGPSAAGPPDLPAAPAAGGPYRVHVGDELALRFYLTPELNEDVRVRPDGRLTTQIAEAVPAAGRTPEEIAATLRADYATELKDPRLTVEVKTPAPTRVYVAGEVGAPGEIASDGHAPSLVQAVARAGGVRPTGDPDAVFVIRRGSDGAPSVYRAHYAKAASGRDPAADAELQDYDIVVVPKTGIAKVYVWVNQHIQQFMPVSWGFAYNVTPLTRP